MTTDTIARGLALAAAGRSTTFPATPEGAMRASGAGGAPTYSASVTNYVPYSLTPTDVAYIQNSNVQRRIKLRRLRVSIISDVAGVVDVTLKVSTNSGLGTSVPSSKHDPALPTVSGVFYTWASAPTLGGGRTELATRKVLVGTSTTAGTDAVFEWDSMLAPTLRDANQFIVVNLAGTALPGTAAANVKINMTAVWEEESVGKILNSGDSTFSNATTLDAAIRYIPGIVGAWDVQNFGNNGKRLLDLLPTASQNTSGLNFTQGGIANALASLGTNFKDQRVVLCWGINDGRDGSTTLAQMIDRLDAEIYAILNGTTSGATYTATKAGGAGGTFTWNATISARPHAKIYLWAPNSFLADDPTSSGSVVNTGAIAGANLAAASQNATNLLYSAYQAFVGDSRIVGVWQKQDYVSPTLGVGFGRTVRTGANNALMTDILHPNATGQFIETEQWAAMMGFSTS